MRKFSDEDVDKIKTHFMFKNVFQMSCRLIDKVEKCGKARQANDDNITRRMPFEWRVTIARKQTHIHKV
jgi:hypothetical protein